MKNSTCYKLIQAVLEDPNNLYYWKKSHYRNTFEELYKEISKFPAYTFDGRFEKIFISLINKKEYKKENCYDEFIKDIENEFVKLKTENIILLPLNFMKSEKINKRLRLSNSINIFTPLFYNSKTNNVEKKFNFHRKTIVREKSLSDYFKEILNCELNKEHILFTKDKNFFNYPILSIVIDNIDSKVEFESGKIAESIYTFLRMLDLEQEREDTGRGLLDSSLSNPASTYTVYYNQKDILCETDNSCYGYSFRYNFSPFLDINTDAFVNKNLDKFTNLLNIYISCCFLDERKFNDEELSFIVKWKNAILLFNNAYESASREKYDISILILTSILESLFLKNEGRDKQAKLSLSISEFFTNNYPDINQEEIADIIKKTYKKRNDFMHEGKGYDLELTLSRRLHDYQGIHPGMKPFTYFGAFKAYDKLSEIQELFYIVLKVLISENYILKLKRCLSASQ